MGPGNRSVSTFLPHPSYPTTKAILIFGEKSPSSDGHNAAGTFWTDIWEYDFEKDKWEEVIVDNAYILDQGGLGWGAGAVELGDDVNELVIWGGLNERNERISSRWKVRLSA